MRSASIFLVLFLLLDGALIYNIQKKIETERAGPTAVPELAQLPKGEYLKKVSLGYDSMVADLLWLKIIQAMGEKKISPKDAEWIYHSLDAATDLDPKFDYMYQLGGIFLAFVAKDYGDSTKILKKGFDNNPRIWELPFFLGFNYFFYLENFRQAAYYMGRAAELPRRPSFVPLLAARLYAESGDPRFGLELTSSIYKNTKDEKVKEALLQRMKELKVEVNLRDLEDASKKFKQKSGRFPLSVEELKAAGLIAAEPKDDFGGKYIINPETGEAANTKMPERLRIYRKGRRR